MALKQQGDSVQLNRAELSRDLDQLGALSTSQLRALVDPSSTSSANPASTESTSAHELLESYSTSTKDHDSSISLAGVYVRAMEDLKKMDDGSLEKLGDQIDRVRHRGEEVQAAFSDIKI